MSDMNQPNPTADAAVDPSASPSDNNSSVNNDNNTASSNNLDVLLLAAAMVTSPSKANANKKKQPSAINNDAAAASADGAHHVSSGMMPTQQQDDDPSTLSIPAQPSSLINSNTFMTKCWPTSSRIASDIFHATSSASSTPTVTPPFTIELVDDIPFAALPTIQNSTAPPRMKTQGSGGTSGGKRGCMNPFALPIKKRYNAAAKMNMMSEGDDGQQPCGEMKQSAALSSTIDIARQDSSSSSTTAAKKKKYRKPQCSHPSCPNRVMNQGVCARHGARVRTCSIPDCTKYAQKGGVCIRHGAVKEYKRCLVGGCKSRPVGKEGVCARHVGVSLVGGESVGPNLALADTAGQEQQQAQDEERQDVITTNVVRNEQQSQQRQLQHQAREQPPNAPQEAVPTSTTIKRPITSTTTIPFKSQSSKKKKCSISQCTKQAKVGGLCMKHGGKVKYRFCNAPHCSNVTQKGGYCKRHFNILVEGVGASGEGGSNKKRRLSEAAAMEGRRE